MLEEKTPVENRGVSGIWVSAVVCRHIVVCKVCSVVWFFRRSTNNTSLQTLMKPYLTEEISFNKHK